MKELNVIKLDKGVTWADAGDSKRMLDMSNKIYDLNKNHNIFVGYLENIALKKGFISENQYYNQIDLYKDSHYARVLKRLIEK